MKPLLLVAATLAASAAQAHHSTLGFFDPAQTIEIEGVLSDISWANPHVGFEVEVTNDAGRTESWHVETSALSALRMRGLDQDFMRPGDRIRVSGAPSRRGESEMNGRTVLLANGTEVVMLMSGAPYFTDPATGNLLDPVYSPDAEARARREMSRRTSDSRPGVGKATRSSSGPPTSARVSLTIAERRRARRSSSRSGSPSARTAIV